MVRTSSAPRSETRRAEILRLAAAVFRRKGFHAAGMREIAHGLGMAPGALYYYFASKEDLLYACQTLSLKRLLESAQRIAAENAPVRTQLARLIRAHLGHVLDEMGGSLAHIQFHGLPGPLLAKVVAKRDAYERILRDVIRRGVETGELRPVDVSLATLTLLGALNWTAVWWRPEGALDLEGVAAQMTTTLLEGLLDG